MSDNASYRTIEEIIGPEAAAKVRAAYGGAHVYIPKEKPRRDEAKALLEKGYSIERIARALGVGKGQVYRLIDRKSITIKNQHHDQ